MRVLAFTFSVFFLLKVFSQNKFNSIFNGKDLSGWVIYGTEIWFVNEEGLIVSKTGKDKGYGYLATEKEYKKFEISAQFLQKRDGNSGLFFHSSIDGTKITGWQAEVAPPGMHTGGIYESYGRGWLIKPNSFKEKYLKYGQWNELRVRVLGHKVITWLNGHKMITLVDEKIGVSEGKIALQIHSGQDVEIYWKNIKIKELD